MRAVLGAIREEADEQGRCTTTVPQIAERAGVSRRTKQIAIKRAKSLGLIAVEDIPGGKHAIANRYVRTYRGGGQSSD